MYNNRSIGKIGKPTVLSGNPYRKIATPFPPSRGVISNHLVPGPDRSRQTTLHLSDYRIFQSHPDWRQSSGRVRGPPGGSFAAKTRKDDGGGDGDGHKTRIRFQGTLGRFGAAKGGGEAIVKSARCNSRMISGNEMFSYEGSVRNTAL
ncbi:hypothetical protein GWI33_021132 [Rhynchophorus ferrugineus]|uniref:Uncharacterized protein n=1 Tax=Rhynchophorus ferrugineus TaxID=354439 RepID=A0A834HPL7_RHYFE|nr:hypothetical protein GWI33_021132 [Rhynchophorus ferrugineus]